MTSNAAWIARGAALIADKHSRVHVAAFLVRIVGNEVTGSKYAAVDDLLTFFPCHYLRQCLCLFAFEHRFGQGGRLRRYLKADALCQQTTANVVSAVVQIVPNRDELFFHLSVWLLSAEYSFLVVCAIWDEKCSPPVIRGRIHCFPL